MAATDEALRHEGGPLEKTHLKDMVQRNALEALVFDKITKHIETEKKAFTRQNTRDETEMKHLLERLHQQQQTTLLDDGDQLSSESGDEAEAETSSETEESDIPANPYPVTIIPKYGTASQAKPATKQDSQKHKPDQNEDLQQFPVGSSVRTRDRKKEWLGDPEAIQSIRRPRKSSSDHKSLIRSQSEQDALGDLSLYISLPPSSTSSQSSLFLSPRDRSNSFGFWKDGPADGGDLRGGALNKRGGSLKERPKKSAEPTTVPLVRSYSMLTKASLRELQNKSVIFSRPKGTEANSMVVQKENSQAIRNWGKTKHGSLKEKRDRNNAIHQQLTEAGMSKKQPLSRKSSREGNDEEEPKTETKVQQAFIRKNSYETKKKTQAGGKTSSTSIDFPTSLEANSYPTVLSQKKKQTFHPNRLSPQYSPNESPNISPLARDNSVFRY